MAFFGDARMGEEGYQAWLSSTFGGDVPGLVEAGLSEAAIGLEWGRRWAWTSRAWSSSLESRFRLWAWAIRA